MTIYDCYRCPHFEEIALAGDGISNYHPYCHAYEAGWLTPIKDIQLCPRKKKNK